ncbi:MAG: UvrD-helicase domain-containing protein, partial [Thermoanaerobaculia bacterium]
KIGDAAARTVFQYVQSVEPPASGATLDDWIIYFEPISEAIVNANLAGDRDLKEALVTLRTSRAKSDTCIYHRLVRHRSAVAIHSLTRRFIDFLDREKRLLGVVDFDDLLLRTVTLLDDAAVLESVRAQFDYIFVDEFQDTDRTQARIIERLARDRTGAWVPGRTIIVGDPKQSIYGFRRADPEMYRAMSDKMIQAGAEHRIIRDQYRSDPPLLDVINVMFEAVFTIGGASNANVFRPAYHELKAGKRECDRELDARFTLLHAEHEPEAIAEWIMRNRDRSERDLQRFAILFRRLTRIDEYLDVFDRYGISYVLPPTKAFLERRAPVDLMAVLRAIAFPFDRGAEISAARTPYFALTDDEIAEGVVVEDQIAADGLKPVATPNAAIGTTPGVATPIEAIDTKTGVGTGFSPSSSPSWRAFRDTLATYREQSRHLTVSGTIDLLVNTANIEDIYAQTADGHRAARHLERVRTLAFEYDQKIGGSIRQFVEEIDRRRDEPDDVEPSLADDDSNAVRIMSVHAAKGLEFETVILPDLAFRTRGGGEGLQLYSVEDPPSLVMTGRAQSLSAHYRFASDGSTRLKKILGDRDEAEVRRLFYVAVTRARTDVVFVCNSVFRNDGFLRCLGETFGFAKDSFASMWGPGRELRELRVNGRAIRVAFDNQSAGEGAGAPLAVARLRDPALETRLAAGAIEALAIATPAAAETFERADAAIARSRSRGRAGGLLLQRFLEQWDGAGDGDDLLQMLAHEAASAEETVAAVRRRIRTIRDSPVMKRILAAETIGREMAIRIAEDGELLERRIDRLIRENGRDVIIDYKSGKPDAARVERDRAQVQQYCRAITAMTGRDCSAMLWYIDLESDVLIET